MGDLKIGDLKIPARISQAQVGLKRDLSMVRDFATSVERKCPIFVSCRDHVANCTYRAETTAVCVRYPGEPNPDDHARPA